MRAKAVKNSNLRVVKNYHDRSGADFLCELMCVSFVGNFRTELYAPIGPALTFSDDEHLN